VISARPGGDRDVFIALLLGALGGCGRLRKHVETLVGAAPITPARRRLQDNDYALLGLLGFHARLEQLLGALVQDGGPNVAVAPATQDPESSLHHLLR